MLSVGSSKRSAIGSSSFLLSLKFLSKRRTGDSPKVSAQLHRLEWSMQGVV